LTGSATSWLTACRSHGTVTIQVAVHARAGASLSWQDAAPAPRPRTVRRCCKAAFLAILACGTALEVAPPPVEEGQGAAPVEAPQAPLETLAPLPELAEEDEPIMAPGESVDVNDVGWTILQAVELGGILESDSDVIDDLTATGRLVGVRFTVENLGEVPLTFVGMDVVDDEGRKYAYLSDGLAFIIEEEACEIEELEPATIITCTAIYDAGADAAGLQAVLTDLSLLGGEEVPVDLELE
jgi:hypothetical protein